MEKNKSIFANQWFVAIVCFIIGLALVTGFFLIIDVISTLAYRDIFDEVAFTKSILFILTGYLFLALFIYFTVHSKIPLLSKLPTVIALTIVLVIVAIILAIFAIIAINVGLIGYYSFPKDIEEYYAMKASFLSAPVAIAMFIPALLLTKYLVAYTLRQSKEAKSKELPQAPTAIPPPPFLFKPQISLSDRVKNLLQIYYTGLAIIGICLLLCGLVSLCISRKVVLVIFTFTEFILGIIIILLCAIFLRKKYEAA